MRKVPLVLALLTGMELTQGAITRPVLSIAAGTPCAGPRALCGPALPGLRRSVRDSPAVYTEDTGWRVGGNSAHLMAFGTEEATVYQVRHRHQEVPEVVPGTTEG
jgi:hypothetical protein